MQEHDKAYRNMFTFPEMVEGLMRDFVSEDWIAQIDFTTLENCNSTFISDDLHERRDDIIWRVRLNDEWFYIYLLLEFQSKNDPWMALRIMVYIGLLYQQLKEINSMLSLSFENWQENFRRECEQKGKLEGKKEGKLEGKLEGQAATLKRQLTKRFGPLSQETQNRIANASLEQLETWSDRVLVAPNLDEVLEMV
jgi:predicted transposase YdaD